MLNVMGCGKRGRILGLQTQTSLEIYIRITEAEKFTFKLQNEASVGDKRQDVARVNKTDSGNLGSANSLMQSKMN